MASQWRPPRSTISILVRELWSLSLSFPVLRSRVTVAVTDVSETDLDVGSPTEGASPSKLSQASKLMVMRFPRFNCKGKSIVESDLDNLIRRVCHEHPTLDNMEERIPTRHFGTVRFAHLPLSRSSVWDFLIIIHSQGTIYPAVCEG